MLPIGQNYHEVHSTVEDTTHIRCLLPSWHPKEEGMHFSCFNWASNGPLELHYPRLFSLSTASGRGWTGFDEKPVATGTWRLIAVCITSTPSVPLLLVLCHSIVAIVRAVVNWTYLWYELCWYSNLGNIVGVFVQLCSGKGQQLTSVPISFRSINTGEQGLGLVTCFISVTLSANNLNTKGRAPSSTSYSPRESHPSKCYL